MLYLRHYSSRKARGRGKRCVGAAKLFIGPGEKVVLLSPWEDAVFAWRHSVYRGDGQIGVECTIFRNEGPHRSSDMILEAERLAWAKFPGARLFTMVDPSAIKRGTTPGYCFLCAGWKRCGSSANGKRIFEKTQ